MAAAHFAVRYAPALLPVFRILGLGPARSGVWVQTDSVRVRMGWGFRASVLRTAIGSIALDNGAVTGWGVHGWRGRWLVNGSSSGTVRLDLQPGVRARVMGIPVRLSTLRISLVGPDGFVSALGGLHS